jgi:hypothetical protein
MAPMAEPAGSSYQVTLRGRFGPSFLATFTAMGVDHAAVSSEFRVAASSDRGMSDIVRMLQARGMVILGIRRVTSAPVPPEPGPDRPAQSRKDLRCLSTQPPARPLRHRELEARRPGSAGSPSPG